MKYWEPKIPEPEPADPQRIPPLSVVCLGLGPFGTAVSTDEAFILLDTFFDLGGTFVDTANVYAEWVTGGAGASEKTLGAWMRSRNVRSNMVIGTKGGHPRLDTMHLSRLTPADIAHDVDESRERLGVETIDLYWLHRDDPTIPIDEIMSAVYTHIDTGAIRALGASNWSVERIEEARIWSRKHNRAGFCASQIAWSLAHNNVPCDPHAGTRAMDPDTMAYHRTSGIPVIPYSAQASGLFARPYDESNRRYGTYHNAATAARYAAVQRLAAQHGVTPNAMALAYLLNHPCCAAAIAGSHTVDQIKDSCSAAEIVLADSDILALEAGMN
jgi:aryl-alcohol dehydrogenase-like predicted oxidoreductase